MKNLTNLSKGVVVMLAFACISPLLGQNTVTDAALKEAFPAKYILKTNLVGLAMYSINLNYEVKTSPRTSAGLLTGYKIPSTITVKAVGELDGDRMDYTGEITPKGFFLNPYFRFYTRKAMTGFYLEGFLRYYNFNYLVPYDYDKDGRNINANLDGQAVGFGGGLAIGGQFALAQRVFMDIYGGFGVANGNIHLETNDPNLDAQDYQDIKRNIEENRDDAEVEIFLLGRIIDDIDADADANHAWADINNQLFPIFRGGITIGYAF